MKPIHLLVAYISLTQSALLGIRFTVVLYAASHYSPVVVGMVLSLYSIPPLLGGVQLGRWADRIGTRVPIVCCCTAMITAALLMAAVQSLWLICLAALLWGAGGFGQHVVCNTLAGRCGRPEDRSANFVLFTTGIAAANATAPYAMGLLIDNVGNFPLIFGLLGLPPAAALLLSRVPGFPASTGTAAPAAGPKKAVLALLRDPLLQPIMLVSTVFVLLWDIFAVMAPLHGKALHLSATEIGIMSSTFSAAAFVIRLVLAPLSRHWTPWRLLIMALLVAGAGLVGFGLSGSLLPLVLFAFVIGSGQGVGAPMSSTVLYDAAPPERLSEANGLRMALGMLTHTVLPLLAGLLGALVGMGPMLVISGVAIAAMAWAYRGQWRGAAS